MVSIFERHILHHAVDISFVRILRCSRSSPLCGKGSRLWLDNYSMGAYGLVFSLSDTEMQISIPTANSVQLLQHTANDF
jgi:hypothetical protein